MNTTEILRNGKFYLAECDGSESVFAIEGVEGERYSACYRNSSCWMKTLFTDAVDEIPNETQYLLVKKSTGYTLYFMLCDGTARSSLLAKEGKLYCRAETGDENVKLGSFRYMYSLDCNDVYEGVRIAYDELREYYDTFKLKGEKNSPDFINGLGYCTYNAFYSDVTHDKLLSVEEAFSENGVKLGFLILDEGWMTARDAKLSGFDASEEKFPKGLAHTISACKRDYGLKQFFCWHTYNGYWKGIDGEVFGRYGVDEMPFSFPERFVSKPDSDVFNATAGEDFYPMNIAYQNSGICRDLGSFYNDFYSALKEKGVDGTKIDAITWQEAFVKGKGGRVSAMSTLMKSITNASQKYLDGELINCSSCSNEFFMNIGGGSVVRTSCDYMPDKPESHFEHIRDNAFVGMWVEPIVIADWDMFETSSEWGSYHAAARAISGGPIYCTDKPQNVNFPLVKSLCGDNGEVNRCIANAKPTEACLFGCKEGEPFRVFNKTASGYVLGVFGKIDTGDEITIPVNEIYGLPKGEYAVYSSVKGFIGEVTEEGFVSSALKNGEAEIFTLVAINNGVAVFGDVTKLNPSAYVYGNVGVYQRGKGFSVTEEVEKDE